MAWKQIVPSRLGSDRPEADNSVRYSTKMQPHAKGQTRYALIIIGKNVLARLHWIKGDRIEVKYDEAARMLKLSPGPLGYRLCASSQNGRKTHGHISFVISGLPMPDAPDRIFLEHEIIDNAIVVALPRA